MAMTAAQIIANACRIAKCPGMSAIAGQQLNAILSDLCRTYDFDVARKTYSFSFNSGAGSNSGPYTLPADWLRGIDRSIFYTISGQPYVMVNISLEEYDMQSQTPGLSGYPEVYTTDLSVSPPVMFVWQPASGSYPVTARYYAQMPDITTPETSNVAPWFPHTDYLQTELAARMMDITDDTRASEFKMRAKDTLSHFLKMEGDTSGRALQVTLDRRSFKRNNNLPSTKIQGPF